MNNDFINQARVLRKEYLLRTENLLNDNRQTWSGVLSEHFKYTCTNVVKLQKESSLHSISYLDYTMLYTNFIKRRYVAEIWIYDSDWYFDKKQCIVGECNISFLFIYFDELWDKLLSIRKRYVGKVTACDVTAFMIETLPDFYEYFAFLLHTAVINLSKEKPFVDIAKNVGFRFNVGDYMAHIAPVISVKTS